MAEFELLGAFAVVLGFGLIVLCFVPYLAWTYRRYGTVLPRHAVLIVGGAVYGVALWTYTILPLPQATVEWCAQHAVHAQLHPLQFVADVRAQATGGLLGNAALRQVVLNVALFVPLGILARAMGRWSLGRIALVGFATSSLVEFTQLTGNWGLYPCAYRVFDVDDLLVNTVGALLGGLLATASVHGADFTAAPRETGIGTGRRLLGMLADVVAVQIAGVAALLLVGLARDPTGHWRPPDALAALVTDIMPATALLLVVPMLARGATIGQLATVVRPVGPDGGPPTRWRMLLRFLTGSGAYFLLTGLAAAGVGGVAPLATAFAVVSLLAAWRTPAHRGLSGLAAGVTYLDARSTTTEMSQAQHVDHGHQLRRMSTAVLSLMTAGYLVLTAIAAIGQASTRAGLTALVVLVIGLAVLTFAMIGYLLVNGAVMLRRERHSLGNLLSLLAGLGTAGLLATCAFVFATTTGPAVALAVGALVLSGYLGFLMLAFIGYGLIYGRAPAPGGVDAIVILGSGLLGSRVPPLLAARLDRAVEIFEAEDTNGNRPLMICSGGQGPGEAVSEAAAMADYLRAKEIPPDLIVEEDRSHSTEQNLRLSWNLAHDHGAHRPIAVTSDYHAFRAAQISTELGISTQVVGARTARYYYPSAVLREFVGVVARRPLAYGLTGLLLAAFAASVTFLVLPQ
ncbi:ElyC/SanA/YdcF family protein [Pseudonocardia humida]|uniref:YdcF family protein n=1 Tax=Pseudonocardia humida TaxID=2800819 RepID=A0ABT1A2B8_9PSEU|nr:ElyC/SanA/YdcF family protein [Pseudonocardia humida]MCO1657137.1 YdcF family protein [Pseudonocardia humida]